MRTRLIAASAAFLALLSASVLVTAGQENKGGGGGGGGDKGTKIRRASVLNGLQVRDKEGDYAGQVYDMVINLESGKILYFAVQTGGTLGFGGQLHAVAPGALRLTEGTVSGRELFAINVDANKIANEKGFNSNNWPQKPTWGEGGRQNGGDKNGGGGGGGGGDAGGGGKNGGKNIARASSVIGMDVHSSKNNDDIGDVYDLAIDTNNWKVHYVAVNRGGPLGGALGAGKLYAVDWKAFKFQSKTANPGDQVLVLNATANDFEKAQGFASNESWPTSPSQAFSGGGGSGGGSGGGGDTGRKDQDK